MTPQIRLSKLPLVPLALFKSSPTRRVTIYASGRIKKTGNGLAGLILTTNTNLTSVPTGSLACPFSIDCNSSDRQSLTLSGTSIFSIHNPEELGKAFDFSVGEKGNYESEDPSKIHDRLAEMLAAMILSATAKRSLSELLGPQEDLGAEIKRSLNSSPALTRMGMQVESLAITGIEPSPDIEKALEAIRSEELKKGADAAVHDRQIAAELKDRLLKEEQLITSKKVAEGERQVIEARFETSKRQATLEGEVQRITLEKDKEALAHEVESDKTRAEAAALVAGIETKAVDEKAKHIIVLGKAEGEALEAKTAALEKLDAKKLQALALSGGKPGAIIAAAFLEMAERAGQIGSLNISPDLLQGLLDSKK